MEEDIREPKVSIVVTSYNKDDVIEDSLKSALNQTYRNIEVILIDDASKDNSYEIGKKILDESLIETQSIKFEENTGGNEARNEGIRRANGEYIQMLDGDDQLMEDAVKKKVVFIKKNPDIDVLYCYGLVEEGEGLKNHHNHKMPFKEGRTALIRFIIKNIIAPHPNSIFLRKKFLTKNKIWFDPKIKICQENDFNLNLLLKTPHYNVLEENLYKITSNRKSSIWKFHSKKAKVEGIEFLYKKLKNKFYKTNFKKDFSYIEFDLAINFIKAGNFLKGYSYIRKSFSTNPKFSPTDLSLKGWRNKIYKLFGWEGYYIAECSRYLLKETTGI